MRPAHRIPSSAAAALTVLIACSNSDTSDTGGDDSPHTGGDTTSDATTSEASSGVASGEDGSTTTSGSATTTGASTGAGTMTDGGGDESTGGGALPPDPAQPGSSTWSESTHALQVDADTTIPLDLFIPDDAGAHPVVVLTHGFQLSPGDYASYGRHLASWGYVAILPQMPGSLISSPTHVELKTYLVAILDFVEAEGGDANGPLLGRADAAAIGLSGHSMGGKISLLTVTEDPRPLAVFGIDPVDAAGGPIATDPQDYPSVTPELMSSISIPLVLLGETTNATGGLGQPCAPADENFHQYYVEAQSPALEIEILGANHMSFLDDPNCGLTCSVCTAGTDDPAVTRQLTHGYMIAFFNIELRDETDYAPYLTGAPIDAQSAAGLVTHEAKNGF